MGEEKRIIYLSKDKNIICVNNTYIDLSTVCYIENSNNEYENYLYLSMLNGENISLFKPEYPKKDFTGVPEYLQKDFTYEEIREIKTTKIYDPYGDLGSPMGDLGVEEFSGAYSKSYRFYNTKELVKIHVEHDNQWTNLKFRIIDKWAGVKSAEDNTFKIKDESLIKLMTDYFKLNMGQENIVSNLEKVFGYSSQVIIECVDIGDFYIDPKGKIIIV